MPLGAPESVAGTRYDFQSPRLLSRNADVPPIDVNFCVSPQKTDLREVAILTAPRAGIEMAVLSGEPGLQVYDGREGFPNAILRPGERYRQSTQYQFRKVR